MSIALAGQTSTQKPVHTSENLFADLGIKEPRQATTEQIEAAIARVEDRAKIQTSQKNALRLQALASEAKAELLTEKGRKAYIEELESKGNLPKEGKKEENTTPVFMPVSFTSLKAVKKEEAYTFSYDGPITVTQLSKTDELKNQLMAVSFQALVEDNKTEVSTESTREFIAITTVIARPLSVSREGRAAMYVTTAMMNRYILPEITEGRSYTKVNMA